MIVCSFDKLEEISRDLLSLGMTKYTYRVFEINYKKYVEFESSDKVILAIIRNKYMDEEERRMFDVI